MRRTRSQASFAKSTVANAEGGAGAGVDGLPNQQRHERIEFFHRRCRHEAPQCQRSPDRRLRQTGFQLPPAGADCRGYAGDQCRSRQTRCQKP